MVVYNYNGMRNDGLILRKGMPLLWQFDGGYVDLDANGTPTSWNYYVTDHLGSTRMIVDSNDSIREVINYYPFGSEMRMEAPAQMTSDPSHPFRFTGKELDKQNGLNMYDFGARWYDVAGVPMWTSVDPLAEKKPNMTPYHYCHNDPVNLIDPDGREAGLPEEIAFAFRHPLAASRIGTVTTGHNVINISTNATRFATRQNVLYGSNTKTQEERGSENGAFRHTLWQAQITAEFGANVAKQIGDAHEDNPNIDMNQTSFTNITDADRSVDLHNNSIGRTIGEKNKGAKMNETAKAVLDVFVNEGLYQAQKVKGGYKLVRAKLNSSKGKELMGIFNQLDENGMKPSERPTSENDEIRRNEALQKSLY